MLLALVEVVTRDDWQGVEDAWCERRESRTATSDENSRRHLVVAELSLWWPPLHLQLSELPRDVVQLQSRLTRPSWKGDPDLGTNNTGELGRIQTHKQSRPSFDDTRLHRKTNRLIRNL